MRKSLLNSSYNILIFKTILFAVKIVSQNFVFNEIHALLFFKGFNDLRFDKLIIK